MVWQPEFRHGILWRFICTASRTITVNACQVQAVQNAMCVISKAAVFFENSPKRQAALEERIRAKSTFQTCIGHDGSSA